MKRAGSLLGLPLALSLALVVVVLGPAQAEVAEISRPATVEEELSTESTPYQGDPESEAGIVAAEDDRLVKVQTVENLAALSPTPLDAPYRLATGSAYTLVLTARSESYTVADLLNLAPQTFVRRPDGSYLLSEHVVIQAGATLNLSVSGGLRLYLASDGDAFVSIVNLGGRLNVTGAKGAPIVIRSFDRGTEKPDRNTRDGRAYIRSVGGQIYIKDASIAHLGFWSGRTGGLSLTGTDRPNSGSLDALGDTLAFGNRAEREHLAAGPRPAEKGESGPTALDDVLPAGALRLPIVDVDNPEYSYVSASITNTVVDGNAFGIFASGANGLDIRESTFQNNLVDGIVLHRYVVNAVIEATSASANGADGIVLSRATTGIVLSQVTVNDNRRNGVTIAGLPLADGPSATGISVGSYGNNTLSNSTASDNGRYGVEVVGGVNIGVLANEVDGNDMGIVVREAATNVDIVGNRVNDSLRQGLAVRDGVAQAVVSGNIVTGGQTSVYLRDSSAEVKSNTLTDATSHAVTLVGEIGGTLVDQNTISGRGPSAIDAERAIDLERRGWDNDTAGWVDTTPFLVTLGRYLQPLTLMWIILGALLLFTAGRGARARRSQHRQHPYADKAPLRTGHRVREHAGL